MTLIELMMTVAIVALLAAVALPAYQGSVRKARRAEAKAALTVAAQRMERVFTETGSYSAAVAGTTFATNSENRYYNLSLPVLTASTYTLSAAPQGTQSQDGCGSFTLNQDGIRGLSGNTLGVSDCW
jgi:type IV pilus assembly protein PilE